MSDQAVSPQASTAENSAGELSEKSVGRIISVNGSQAIVLLDGTECDLRPVMGTLLRVDTPTSVVLGLVSAQSVPVPTPSSVESEIRIVELELVGEVLPGGASGGAIFQRGVTKHPSLGDRVFKTSVRDLEMAYLSPRESINVGALSQDSNIPAKVLIDELLSKHFAVLGTTGTGKSCAVALILQSILDSSPDAHVLLLDPHAEYSDAFGERAEVISFNNLDLPYWLFTFEEIVEVIIGDAPDADEEIDILAELIPIAKQRYASNKRRASDVALRRDNGEYQQSTSVDTPNPYRISDLLEVINQRMGSLELKNALRPYKRLKGRIEALAADPRYSFMFGRTVTQDQMAAVLGRLFRIPVRNKPIAILELNSLPSEIVNVLVSVICRLSFDFAMWSEGQVPLTIVCEEAHRYIPSDARMGFDPARRALARIAKEGRKYGVSLCVISQRPGELDPTILSQCNTVFSLRLSNEDDQHIVRAAISDAAASLLEFLPALGEREAIAFGDGVTLPMRFRFKDLPAECLPRSSNAQFSEKWKSSAEDERFVEGVVRRWRCSGQAESDLTPEMLAVLEGPLGERPSAPPYMDHEAPGAGDPFAAHQPPVSPEPFAPQPSPMPAPPADPGLRPAMAPPPASHAGSPELGFQAPPAGEMPAPDPYAARAPAAPLEDQDALLAKLKDRIAQNGLGNTQA